MLTSPLTRPLCRPLATALTDARVSAPAAAGTVWDAAKKSAGMTLSNGDRTATTVDDAGDAVVSATSQDSGKRALKFTAAFTGDASSGEVAGGIVLATYDPSVDGGFPGVTYFAMGSDGFKQPGLVDLGLPFASEEWFAVLVNQTTGKGWFRNQSGGSGDPEAGTGEHFTFTPGTAFRAVALLYSADDSSPASLTLDTTYSSGTYAAWDS